VAAVVDIAENGYAARPEFQGRIDATFPMRDGQCCARVTAAIEELDTTRQGEPGRVKKAQAQTQTAAAGG
jgi:hypothetical protein